MKNLSYEERLRLLGLPTLLYRRDRTDMIQMFKILNDYEEIHINNIKVSNSNITRGHNFKIDKQRVNSRYGTQRFSTRAVNPWNKLPSSLVQAESVNSFKSGLNEAWKCKDTKFSYNT